MSVSTAGPGRTKPGSGWEEDDDDAWGFDDMDEEIGSDAGQEDAEAAWGFDDEEIDAAWGFDDDPKTPSPTKATPPSPIKPRAPSPAKKRAPSPVKQRAPSPTKQRAPSPVKSRPRSPTKATAPSPIKQRAPSPVKKGAPSPVKQKAPVTVKAKASSPTKPATISPAKQGGLSSTKTATASPARPSGSTLAKQTASSPIKAKVVGPSKPTPVSPAKQKVASPIKPVAPSPTKQTHPSPIKPTKLADSVKPKVASPEFQAIRPTNSFPPVPPLTKPAVSAPPPALPHSQAEAIVEDEEKEDAKQSFNDKKPERLDSWDDQSASAWDDGAAGFAIDHQSPVKKELIEPTDEEARFEEGLPLVAEETVTKTQEDFTGQTLGIQDQPVEAGSLPDTSLTSNDFAAVEKLPPLNRKSTEQVLSSIQSEPAFPSNQAIAVEQPKISDAEEPVFKDWAVDAEDDQTEDDLAAWGVTDGEADVESLDPAFTRGDTSVKNDLMVPAQSRDVGVAEPIAEQAILNNQPGDHAQTATLESDAHASTLLSDPAEKGTSGDFYDELNRPSHPFESQNEAASDAMLKAVEPQNYSVSHSDFPSWDADEKPLASQDSKEATARSSAPFADVEGLPDTTNPLGINQQDIRNGLLDLEDTTKEDEVQAGNVASLQKRMEHISSPQASQSLEEPAGLEEQAGWDFEQDADDLTAPVSTNDQPPVPLSEQIEHGDSNDFFNLTGDDNQTAEAKQPPPKHMEPFTRADLSEDSFDNSWNMDAGSADDGFLAEVDHPAEPLPADDFVHPEPVHPTFDSEETVAQVGEPAGASWLGAQNEAGQATSLDVPDLEDPEPWTPEPTDLTADAPPMQVEEPQLQESTKPIDETAASLSPPIRQQSVEDDFFKQLNEESVEDEKQSEATKIERVPTPERQSSIIEQFAELKRPDSLQATRSSDLADMTGGGGLVVSTTTVVSQVLQESLAAQETPGLKDEHVVKQEDLSVLWEAALGDEELLEEESAVDPSAFFDDDGEGFLDEAGEEGTFSPPAPTPVRDSFGKLQGFDTLSRSTSRPSSQHYQPSGAQTSKYAPAAASRPATQPAPASHAPAQSQYAPFARAAPPQPAATTGSTATPLSFANQAKGGYSSPFDAPMDLSRPKRMPSRQAMNQQAQQQNPVPPPRSSSITSLSPTSNRPPSSSGYAPAAQASRPPPSGASAFFEELPMAPKVRPPSTTGRMTAPPSGGPPQAAPSRTMPPPQKYGAPPASPPKAGPAPPAGYGLVAPERKMSFEDAPQPFGQPPTGAAPSKTAPPSNRYSPAPAALQQGPPAANRYAPPPPGAPARPPSVSSVQYQPRTSSPLAQHTTAYQPDAPGAQGRGHPSGQPRQYSISEVLDNDQSIPQNHLTPGVDPSTIERPNVKQRGYIQSQPQGGSYAPTQAHTSAQQGRRIGGPADDTHFIPPSDERQQDPLKRWQGCPIVQFGFGGSVVTSFPKRMPRFVSGQKVPSVMCGPGDVKVNGSKLLPLDDLVISFPGPLKAKGKKKDVMAWLDRGVQQLETNLTQGNVPSALLNPPNRYEERILLWKILRALVEYDGNIEANPAAVIALRQLLSPELKPSDSAPDMYGGSYRPTGIISNAQSAPKPAGGSDVVEQVRKLLLQGDREKAVWHAVDQRLWGHAMLIASTLSKDVWKQVAQEFVRNDVKSVGENAEPLAALYNIFAGNSEDSVDELVSSSARAGLQMINKTTPGGPAKNAFDGLNHWRETLSLILGNRSADDVKALASLGNLLSTYGRNEAAHICYLFARLPGLIGGAEQPQAAIVLLGENHRQDPMGYAQNLTSVLLTEVYEFATCILATPAAPTFGHLQAFKFWHASMLAESGHSDQAQQYCDAINAALKGSTKAAPYYHAQLFAAVDDLSSRLQSAPRDGTGKWMTRPNMDKVSGSVWNRFTQFVAGDESDSASTASKAEAEGPFSRIAGTPNISRGPSPANVDHSQGTLNGYGAPIPPGPVPPVVTNSRYAPKGPYASQPAGVKKQPSFASMPGSSPVSQGPASAGYQPPPSAGYQPPPSAGYQPPPSAGYQPPASAGYQPPPSAGYPASPSAGYQASPRTMQPPAAGGANRYSPANAPTSSPETKFQSPPSLGPPQRQDLPEPSLSPSYPGVSDTEMSPAASPIVAPPLAPPTEHKVASPPERKASPYEPRAAPSGPSPGAAPSLAPPFERKAAPSPPERKASPYEPRPASGAARSSNYAPRPQASPVGATQPSPEAKQTYMPYEPSANVPDAYSSQAPTYAETPQISQMPPTPQEDISKAASPNPYQPSTIPQPEASQEEVPTEEPVEEEPAYEPPLSMAEIRARNKKQNSRPPTRDQEPTGGYEPPASSFEPPTGGYEPPTGGYEPPAGGYEPPGDGYQPPSAGYQPPSAGYQPPSAGYAPPSAGYEPPSAGYEPPSAGYEPPSAHFASPTQPTANGDAPESPPAKKKGMMDLSDDEDDVIARAAALKKSGQSDADRQADDAFRKAAEADAARDKGPERTLKPKASGWLGGWFARGKAEDMSDPNAKKPIKARLGEENSFYFDPQLKKWVNKNAKPEDQAAAAAPTPPPPRGGPPPPRGASPMPGAGPPPTMGTPPPPQAPGAAGMTPPRRPGTGPPGGPTMIGGEGGVPAGLAPGVGGPPSRPSTAQSGLSAASSIDDLLGAPAARKGGTVKGKRKGRGYVDVMAK